MLWVSPRRLLEELLFGGGAREGDTKGATCWSLGDSCWSCLVGGYLLWLAPDQPGHVAHTYPHLLHIVVDLFLS